MEDYTLVDNILKNMISDNNREINLVQLINLLKKNPSLVNYVWDYKNSKEFIVQELMRSLNFTNEFNEKKIDYLSNFFTYLNCFIDWKLHILLDMEIHTIIYIYIRSLLNDGKWNKIVKQLLTIIDKMVEKMPAIFINKLGETDLIGLLFTILQSESEMIRNEPFNILEKFTRNREGREYFISYNLRFLSLIDRINCNMIKTLDIGKLRDTQVILQTLLNMVSDRKIAADINNMDFKFLSEKELLNKLKMNNSVGILVAKILEELRKATKRKTSL